MGINRETIRLVGQIEYFDKKEEGRLAKFAYPITEIVASGEGEDKGLQFVHTGLLDSQKQDFEKDLQRLLELTRKQYPGKKIVIGQAVKEKDVRGLAPDNVEMLPENIIGIWVER